MGRRGGYLNIKAIAGLCALAFLLAGCGGSVGLQTADEFLGKKDYVRAAEAYEQVLQTSEDSSTRKQVEEKIGRVRVLIADEYVARADERYGSMGDATIPALNGILDLLRGVERWDDSQGRLGRKLALLEKEAAGLTAKVDDLQKKGAAAARSFQYDAALAAIDKAAALDPSSGAVVSARTEVVKQKKLYGEAVTLLEEEKLDRAMEKYRKLAATYDPPLALAAAPLAADAAALVRKEAASMAAENRWLEAIDYLKGWDLKALDGAVRDTYRGAAGYFLATAKTAMEGGEAGKAYLYSLKAVDLDPKNMEIFNLNKRARDAVDKEIQSYIAVASFDSPSDDPDAGKQFSDSLVSFLYQVLPYGINILERDKIDYVLKEHRNETGKAGDALGVDLVVTGTVSLFRVESSVDKRMATVKVTVGEETVENPEFTQMVRLHGSDTSTWPEVPPKTIKKGNVQLIKYTKGSGRKKAFAKVSIRIFDTDKGTITFVKDYDADVARVSEFQDEVADAGIEYIPMTLPTDTELKEEMRKGIVQEIAKVVQASFERREARFLNQVRFFLDRREAGAALAPLAGGYLYCLQDGIDKANPEFVELSRMVEEMVR